MGLVPVASLKFPRNVRVTQAKKDALLERIERLGIALGAIEEQAIKAGGPGGQKVNKSAAGVLLRYPPGDLVVKCTRDRSRALNRFLALRTLVDTIEQKQAPEQSQRLKQNARIRKQKDRRRRRKKA